MKQAIITKSIPIVKSTKFAEGLDSVVKVYFELMHS
jgi:hypothetical protein